MPPLGVGVGVGRGHFHPEYFAIDTANDEAYTIILRNSELESFYIMALRMYGTMHHLRSRASSVARLVMLALCLQLALPLALLSAASAEADLRSDLRTSICHEAGDDDEAPGSRPDGRGTPHCIFCLPLAGASVPPAAGPAMPLPPREATLHVLHADHQAPESSRPAAARSRAPPSDPRIA